MYKVLNPIFPHTELSIDLKLLTLKPGRMAVGEYHDGMLMHDGDDHFTFIEDATTGHKPAAVKRNLHIFVGKYVTLTVRDDDTPRLNFKEVHWTPDFCIAEYAMAVEKEVKQALWEFRSAWWRAL